MYTTSTHKYMATSLRVTSICTCVYVYTHYTCTQQACMYIQHVLECDGMCCSLQLLIFSLVWSEWIQCPPFSCVCVCVCVCVCLYVYPTVVLVVFECLHVCLVVCMSICGVNMHIMRIIDIPVYSSGHME